MNSKEQEQLLKSFKEGLGNKANADINIDVVKINDIKNETEKLINNKNLDVISLYKGLKENLEKAIEAAPLLKSMLLPNLNSINKILKELTEKENI